jgi:hypothetical protein
MFTNGIGTAARLITCAAIGLAAVIGPVTALAGGSPSPAGVVLASDEGPNRAGSAPASVEGPN